MKGSHLSFLRVTLKSKSSESRPVFVEAYATVYMETRSPCMCSPVPLLQTGKPCLRVDHSMMGLFHGSNPTGFCSALSPQATISAPQSDRVVSLMGQDKAFPSGILVKQSDL